MTVKLAEVEKLESLLGARMPVMEMSGLWGTLGERRHQVEQGGDTPCKSREDFLQLCLPPTYTELFSELLPCKEMRRQVVQQLTSAWVGQSECCWVLPDPGSLSVRSVCLAQ